ncbi:MAG: sulfur oxidation c-type cytochrome SoxX [Rhizobiaceae bacterium]
MLKPILAGGLAIFMSGIAFAAETTPDKVTFAEGEVQASLTGQAGDAKAGREWFAGRKLGNCLACHQTSDLDELPFHGEVGPPMDGVADRYEVAQLRAIIVNSKEVFGDETIMPGFYSSKAGARVAEKFQGKTILNAQQVEDIIAYLTTLKE